MLDITDGKDEQSGEDFRLDCWLLEHSDIFDATGYRVASHISPDADPAEHYLREGWKRGIQPSPNFDGVFLYPYFRSAGFSGPPALTYIQQLAAVGVAFARREEAETLATLIRASELFNAEAYIARVGNIDGIDPVLHYVIVGERMGFAPSQNFDPTYYLERYPDTANVPNKLVHYLQTGREEGRRAVSVGSRLILDRARLNTERETILLAVHQASRTGAPILAYNIATRLGRRYNVVALLLSGGELVDDFRGCCAAVVGPLTYADWHAADADRLVTKLLAAHSITYAIANSIESRIVLKPLALAQIPVVALVHEFASSVPPRGEMARSLEWASQIVFSAELTAAAAREDGPNLDNRTIHILHQGLPDLPPRGREMLAAERHVIRNALRPANDADMFVVLGCGTIHMRKGVDVFLSCASAVAALKTRRPVRFVWIGNPPPGEVDRFYECALDEQVARAGLKHMVTFVDEVADLELAYTLADLFLMSSRLDPLPNVAIEATMRGLPVVCFENATGIAEILKEDPTTCAGVVPYLDAHAAAQLIARLADDPVGYEKMSQATSFLARRTFDMDSYVGHLDELGRQATAQVQQRRRDFEVINADPLFDIDHMLGLNSIVYTRQDAIRLFLLRSAAFGVGRRPAPNFYYRRPGPGFHPQIYEHENAGSYDRASVNSLAHFIRSGKPDGPWRHEVITPAGSTCGKSAEGTRIALHAHFYYPELAVEFMRRVAPNRSRCDLVLTTDSDNKAAALRRATKHYEHGQVLTYMVPNRGRDIGPFLTALGEEILVDYDIIGHVHGKRSLFAGEIVGETWREFIWQNLLGERYPMMDIIIGRFAENPSLGLVFPDDPHLSDWDGNLQTATELARRMGIADPLPPFFNFPVGTMFWARFDALRPLFDLNLSWEDYPAEPVPIDGTVLHAIERLLPLVAHQAGYKYATTHIPGVTW